MAHKNFGDNTIVLLGCINVWMSGACRNITMINCSGMTGNPSMNGRTYINNAHVLKQAWSTIDSTNSSAASPTYYAYSTKGNKFKVDTSGGDVYHILNGNEIGGDSVYFKIIDASNNLVLSSLTNTETIDGNALPYTISPTIYDSYQIGWDGTNFYIL